MQTPKDTSVSSPGLCNCVAARRHPFSCSSAPPPPCGGDTSPWSRCVPCRQFSPCRPELLAQLPTSRSLRTWRRSPSLRPAAEPYAVFTTAGRSTGQAGSPATTSAVRAGRCSPRPAAAARPQSGLGGTAAVVVVSRQLVYTPPPAGCRRQQHSISTEHTNKYNQLVPSARTDTQDSHQAQYTGAEEEDDQ